MSIVDDYRVPEKFAVKTPDCQTVHATIIDCGTITEKRNDDNGYVTYSYSINYVHYAIHPQMRVKRCWLYDEMICHPVEATPNSVSEDGRILFGTIELGPFANMVPSLIVELDE